MEIKPRVVRTRLPFTRRCHSRRHRARRELNLQAEQSLLAWLELHEHYALALVFCFAFAEACIGIGLLVSGVFLVTVSSWLYTNGAYGLPQILPLALLGATLGDHAGFYFGRWFGPRLHEFNFVRARLPLLQRIEQLTIKYGPFAVFIGRFVPAIRSLVPALLGVSGFNRLHFSLLDIGACLLWSLGLGAILISIDTMF